MKNLMVLALLCLPTFSFAVETHSIPQEEIESVIRDTFMIPIRPTSFQRTESKYQRSSYYYSERKNWGSFNADRKVVDCGHRQSEAYGGNNRDCDSYERMLAGLTGAITRVSGLPCLFGNGRYMVWERPDNLTYDTPERHFGVVDCASATIKIERQWDKRAVTLTYSEELPDDRGFHARRHLTLDWDTIRGISIIQRHEKYLGGDGEEDRLEIYLRSMN